MTERGEIAGGRIGAWLLVATLVYFGGLIGALFVGESFEEERRQVIAERWFEPGAESAWPDGETGLARHFATWDAQHYLYLAQQGYAPGVPSNAFYPLWPLLIRGVTHLTGWSTVAVGMVLANSFALGAWVLFYGVAARRFGREVATWALVLLLAFPGSLFLRFVYSEALFLLLVLVLWNGLEQRRYGWVVVAALLLPVTRGVGAFCILPIAWHWILRLRETGVTGTPWRTGFVGIATVLSPAVGWVGYLALMMLWTGDPLAGIEAQRHWNVHAIGNLWDVLQLVAGLLHPTTWHDFRGSMLDRLVFVLVLVLLPVIKRLGWDLVVWTYVLAVIPAMSGTFVSFTRFAGCAFPVFLGLAFFLCQPTRTWARWVVLGVFVLLHAVLVWQFLNFRWAG